MRHILRFIINSANYPIYHQDTAPDTVIFSGVQVKDPDTGKAPSLSMEIAVRTTLYFFIYNNYIILFYLSSTAKTFFWGITYV